MKESGSFKGNAIRLLSCNTGNGDYSFAQGLADGLGVPVKAPTSYLWVTPQGKHFVADGKIANGKLVPVAGSVGRFRTFKPRRRKTK